MYDLNKPVKEILNIENDWSHFSHYFMFMTLHNGGCSKSSSGSLSITFPSHWEEEMIISVQLGGYDMPSMARNEYIEQKTATQSSCFSWRSSRDFILTNG